MSLNPEDGPTNTITSDDIDKVGEEKNMQNLETLTKEMLKSRLKSRCLAVSGLILNYIKYYISLLTMRFVYTYTGNKEELIARLKKTIDAETVQDGQKTTVVSENEKVQKSKSDILKRKKATSGDESSEDEVQSEASIVSEKPTRSQPKRKANASINQKKQRPHENSSGDETDDMDIDEVSEHEKATSKQPKRKIKVGASVSLDNFEEIDFEKNPETLIGNLHYC